MTDLSLPGDMLYSVTAPHFAAGLTVSQDGAITSAASIISWAQGGTFASFRRYCERKGWDISEVPK